MNTLIKNEDLALVFLNFAIPDIQFQSSSWMRIK